MIFQTFPWGNSAKYSRPNLPSWIKLSSLKLFVYCWSVATWNHLAEIGVEVSVRFLRLFSPIIPSFSVSKRVTGGMGSETLDRPFELYSGLRIGFPTAVNNVSNLNYVRGTNLPDKQQFQNEIQDFTSLFMWSDKFRTYLRILRLSNSTSIMPFASCSIFGFSCFAFWYTQFYYCYNND